MGRKPKALILQFFERGAKLPDLSNRYQHTCKSCGEKFPKGRIDSLTTHLLTKCPTLSKADRLRVRNELSSQKTSNHSTIRGASGAMLASGNAVIRGQEGELQMNGTTLDMPILTHPSLSGHNWSGLETLAEAARHSDLTEKPNPTSKDQTARERGVTLEHFRDPLELQEQYDLDNPPLSYEKRIQKEKKVVNNRPTQQDNEVSVSPAPFTYSNSRSNSPNLASVAVAAVAAASFEPSMLDPQLLNDQEKEHHHAPEDAIEQQINQGNSTLGEHFFHSESQGHWPSYDSAYDERSSSVRPDQEAAEFSQINTDVSHTNKFPRIAMNTNEETQFTTSEYVPGEEKSATHPKARSKFPPARRGEVQAVRKLGSCLRCRMLKKKCSLDTPCDACGSVESARMWVNACTRTKMADDMEIWSAALHTLLSYKNLETLKEKYNFQPADYHIEATHYPAAGISVTLFAQEGQRFDTGIDPSLHSDFNTQIIRAVDAAKDDLPAKVSGYIKSMLQTIISSEKSPFMKTTLLTAWNLSNLSNDNAKDDLLSMVIQLWAIVHLLTDHDYPWKISIKFNEEARMGHGSKVEDMPDGEYKTICMQLNGALEIRAAALCKHILNRFDQKLVVMQGTVRFEFYITALVLLSSFEKGVFLFKSWEQTGFRSDYPDIKDPEVYIRQTEEVAALLSYVLDMRHVYPLVEKNEVTGILGVVDPSTVPAVPTPILTAEPVKKDINPVYYSAAEIAAAQKYFEQLNLTHTEVLSRSQNPVFNHQSPHCYEFCFTSRLLLPKPKLKTKTESRTP